MITIENTKENRAIKSVISSMAVENMFFDEKYINEILKDKIVEILHISSDEVEEIINILQKEEKDNP